MAPLAAATSCIAANSTFPCVMSEMPLSTVFASLTISLAPLAARSVYVSNGVLEVYPDMPTAAAAVPATSDGTESSFSSTTDPSSPGALSSGAKAGIAVAVVLAFFIGLLVCVCYCHARNSSRSSSSSRGRRSRGTIYYGGGGGGAGGAGSFARGNASIRRHHGGRRGRY